MKGREKGSMLGVSLNVRTTPVSRRVIVVHHAVGHARFSVGLRVEKKMGVGRGFVFR